MIGAEREREGHGAGAERRAGVTKVGLSGERQIGRSRSAHMLSCRVAEYRSLADIDGFSNFFVCWIRQEICNKVILTLPPYVKHVAALRCEMTLTN